MNNIFQEINKLSISINERIAKLDIDFEDGYEGKRNREIVKIELDKDEKAVLVLGINPSINKSKGEDKYPDINFLKAVNCEKRSKNNCTKYTNRYHQSIYNYAFNGFSMMWEKESYLNTYLEQYSNIDDEELRIKDKQELVRYLNNHKANSKNYVLFTDLLHFKVTNAGKITPILDITNDVKYNVDYKEFKKLQDDIFRMFELQVKYYSPKLIWIHNKSIKQFLEKYFSQQGISIKAVQPQTSSDNSRLKNKVYRAVYNDVVIIFTNFFNCQEMLKDGQQEKKFIKQQIDSELAQLNMVVVQQKCNCKSKDTENLKISFLEDLSIT